MANKLDTFKMETKFDGLIKLLAEGLYSEPDIFLRELIQNAHDSIVRRQDIDKNLKGRIEIFVDQFRKTIIIQDNGIGMDEPDIRDFLSVIGTGYAREHGTSIPYELIGQFGIGMLSAFVVAEKVYVETLKLNSSAAFEWRNSGSEECELYDSGRTEVGSKITVYVRDTHTYLLQTNKLHEIIIKYCDFISYPIYLNGEGPVNEIDAPWNKAFADKAAENAAYKAFIDRRFTDYELDVFPIVIKGEYNAKGILYISDRHIADVNTGGILDIFIRKMLVKKDDNELLPSWAKFVRGVIDSPDLKPTAARDNVQKGKVFDSLKVELGQIIVERLTYLSKNHPDRFKAINQWHHYHLKGMALYYNDFFNAIADMLMFETNKGQMSIKEYLSKNEPMPDRRAPIYFFSYDDSAAQYYRLANAQGLVVINTGHRFEEELVKKYAQKYPEQVALQQFDILSEGVIFADLAEEEQARFEPLEQALTFALTQQSANVLVKTKRFKPASIPALISETARTKAEEELRELLVNPRIRMSMADTWDDVIKDQYKKQRKLFLNADNEIVKMLISMSDKILRMSIAMGIYNNAMLYSHRLDEQNMNIVHDCISSIMHQVLILNEEKLQAEAKIEEQRTELRVSKSNDETAQKPEHIRIFMITPFADEYKIVENAVRLVFESAPFFFEVRLARDYTHEGNELIDNVKQHIATSHGFIAEISELNPNVMLEVGGILMRKDSRPLFSLRSNDSTLRVPADFVHKLRIPYPSRSSSVEEIKQAILQELIANDRIKHEDAANLIKLRKAHFLSETVCNNLSIPLRAGQVKQLMGHFSTVESLINAQPENVEQNTKIHKGIVTAIQDELRGAIKHG